MKSVVSIALVVSCTIAGSACSKPEPAAAAAFTTQRLEPSQGELAKILPAEVAKAKAQHLKPFVELGATWCGPCKELEASMGDARMKDAFAGTYVISLDLDAWKSQLAPLGLATGAVPAFYEVDDQGHSTGRTIDGGAWAENVPANMAPPLKAFFASK